MSGPVCPTCGGPFGNCSCYSKGAAGRAERRAERAENRAIRRARRGRIDLPAPGESAGCGDVVARLAMVAARKVVLLGLLLVGVGVLTLVM